MQDSESRNPAKQRVLFVTNAFSYGGSEKHLLELLQRLDDPRVESVILCTDSDPFSQRLSQGQHSSVAIRSEKSLKTVWIGVESSRK